MKKKYKVIIIAAIASAFISGMCTIAAALINDGVRGVPSLQ